MKRIIIMLIATIVLCSCNSNFEDYFYYASYFPELKEEAELKLQCSFLRVEGQEEALISIKQLDANDEIIQETGDVVFYTINGDELELERPLCVRLIDRHSEWIVINVRHVSYDKDGVFVMGRSDDSDRYTQENQVVLSFEKGQMADYVSFTKK